MCLFGLSSVLFRCSETVMSSQLSQLAYCVWFSAVCVVSKEGAHACCLKSESNLKKFMLNKF